MSLVKPFLEKYPNVRVEFELTNRPVNLVEEGFDLAIHAGTLTDSSLVAYKLMDSAFRLVAAPAYLELRGEPERIQDLRGHDCVIFGTTSTNASWSIPTSRKTVTVPIRGRVAV